MTTPETAWGTLETADLREAWKHEATEFTPWLEKNLDRLGKELGIELEAEGTEVHVGPGYRADIVARDRMDDSRVVIENQLEAADLQHLGQVLAYLAGLEAKTVVWVASDFDEAHRSAVRWLNDHTVPPYAFFAVRVRAVRIADSPLAPVFEVLERPSNWDRSVRETTTGGSRSWLTEFRRDFWAHVASRHPGEVKPGFRASNVYHRVEEAGLRISLYVSQNGVGIFLVGMRGESGEAAKYRAKLYQKPLRAALGGEQLRSTTGWSFYDIDPHDRANWDRMADWLHERRVVYERVLRETEV